MGNVLSWVNSNFAGDQSQGEARQENQPQSLWGFISTLLPGIIVSSFYIITFIITRRKQRRFYAPRTYLGSLRDHERSPELPDSLFRWFGEFWKLPDIYALQHQSLDAYFFLRYLSICTTICFVNLCITWPILLPINITGGNGKTQLELLSYSNIDISKNTVRLYAHVLVAWMNYGFIMYMITRECIFYINLRQAFLLTPQSERRISSRTVLFTCVPEDYLDESMVQQMFGSSVKNIWLINGTKSLSKLVKERDEMALLLEKSQVKFLKRASRQRIKSEKPSKGISTRLSGLLREDAERGSTSSTSITDKMRPRHRTGFLGLFGKKVDTIQYSRSKLTELIPEVRAAQEEWKVGKARKGASMFVEFHTQSAAQAAYQQVTYHQAFRMSPKYIGIRPEEVLWDNLGVAWWRAILFQYIVYGLIAILIIFWAIPVGFVGIIAQVSIIDSLPGLTWIKSLPSQIIGFISGLLPSAVLSWLISLVPVIMGYCARLSGAVSFAEVELFIQDGFFMFQLIQVFLIRTITDTASSAFVEIAQSPTSVFGILAGALPTSSNFYISYFIIQGFTIATSVMTQVVSCVVFNIFYKFLARTPRAMFRKWSELNYISWGSIMPVHTGIVVISVTYAVIAPFVLLWSTIGIWIFYQAYRYDVFFVSDTKINTNGLIYPKALKQLFSGIYLAEICLIGIFAASKALGQAGLMVVFLIFTILYQITLNRAVDPLLYNLPCSLHAEERLHQRLLSENATAEDKGMGMLHVDTASTLNERRGSAQWIITQCNRTGNKFWSMVLKFLKPWDYADYWSLRKLVPHEDNYNYPSKCGSDVETTAYLPPAVSSEVPTLWIPEDPMGLSKMEIEDSRGIIETTDEGCRLDEKSEMVWDIHGARPPIWKEKVNY